MASSPLRARASALADLAQSGVDVLVIGGGITGAGVALDAATRGLRVALVERHDFASGTSSKSSKLIHGGVRYLRQREFGLVHEALTERHRLLQNAPHLVEEAPFLVPVIAAPDEHGRAKARVYQRVMSVGLWTYDAIGSWRAGRIHKRASRERVMELMPALDRDRVVGGYLYVDARADDARLTLAIAQTAHADYGTTICNYSEVMALHTAEGRVSGATVRDALSGEIYDIAARAVVNAAGVWSDEVRALAGPHPHAIRPAKGVHITVPAAKLPVRTSAVLQVTGDDRIIFVIPWEHYVYVGTTDTDYHGSLDDPQCDADDIAYLLGAVNACVRQALTPADITATWAGLRPLIAEANSAKTADLSRRHSVLVSDSGLVTITGGKLTSYRKMAEDTVDAVVELLELSPKPKSGTEQLLIYGADGLAALTAPDAAARLGIDDAMLDHLRSRYGVHARTVAALLHNDSTLAQPIVPGLSYLAAEVIYAIRYELACTLDDVLARRTRALILDREGARAAAPQVAALMAPELGWDEAEINRQVAAFETICVAEAAAESPSARLGE
ncbi:MAG: FAD-dependent oxidoreductase [Acidimicrobiia bacterium]